MIAEKTQLQTGVTESREAEGRVPEQKRSYKWKVDHEEAVWDVTKTTGQTRRSMKHLSMLQSRNALHRPRYVLGLNWVTNWLVTGDVLQWCSTPGRASQFRWIWAWSHGQACSDADMTHARSPVWHPENGTNSLKRILTLQWKPTICSMVAQYCLPPLWLWLWIPPLRITRCSQLVSCLGSIPASAARDWVQLPCEPHWDKWLEDE